MYVWVSECTVNATSKWIFEIGSTTLTGYKHLESKLELQLLPTFMIDRPAEILSTFERQVILLPLPPRQTYCVTTDTRVYSWYCVFVNAQAASEVSYYMDKLLEEVDESQVRWTYFVYIHVHVVRDETKVVEYFLPYFLIHTEYQSHYRMRSYPSIHI